MCLNYAVIDIGSNTMRLSVYSCCGGHVSVLFTKKETAGLAGYVTDGAMTEDGADQCVTVLKSFQESLLGIRIDGLSVFATASLRNICNTEDILRTIARRTGIKVEILSGQEEAVLDFIGATHSVGMKNGLLIDIGGGSTELTAFSEQTISCAESISMGSLSLYTNYVEELLPTPAEQKAIRRAVWKKLETVKPLSGSQFTDICGVGGTIRAVQKMNRHVGGHSDGFSVKELRTLLAKMQKPDKGTLRMILKAVPDRIHTLIPGMLILDTAAEYFKSECVQVSAFGVREGFLYARVLGESIRMASDKKKEG